MAWGQSPSLSPSTSHPTPPSALSEVGGRREGGRREGGRKEGGREGRRRRRRRRGEGGSNYTEV